MYSVPTFANNILVFVVLNVREQLFARQISSTTRHERSGSPILLPGCPLR